MGRLCERPGCSDVAAMAYGFDVDRLLVWLALRDPDGGDPMRAGSLCKRHADAMVVPQGWTLDDRREPTPRLFRPTPRSTTDKPLRARGRRDPADGAGGDQLELAAVAPAPADVPVGVPPPTAVDQDAGDVDTVEVVVVEELEPDVATVASVTGSASADDDPDATVAIPWLPTADEGDDLDGVLSARSPLLARAFRGTDRPR